jgi:hypothetical protein
MVNMRVLALDDGRVVPDPRLDGASKLIDACGATLVNVNPGGVDGRVSGIIIKKPGDAFSGGLPLEFRYAGYTPEDTNEKGVVAAATAHFEVIASHVDPDVATAIVAAKTEEFSTNGRQTPVDPRFSALFGIKAYVEIAHPRFRHYAETHGEAVTNGVDARRNTMASSGYGSMFGGVDGANTRPLIELPSQLPAIGKGKSLDPPTSEEKRFSLPARPSNK